MCKPIRKRNSIFLYTNNANFIVNIVQCNSPIWLGDDIYKLIEKYITHSTYNEKLYSFILPLCKRRNKSKHIESSISSSGFKRGPLVVPSKFVNIKWFTNRTVLPVPTQPNTYTIYKNPKMISMYDYDEKKFMLKNTITIKFKHHELNFVRENIELDGVIRFTYINPRRSTKWFKKKIFELEII